MDLTNIKNSLKNIENVAKQFQKETKKTKEKPLLKEIKIFDFDGLNFNINKVSFELFGKGISTNFCKIQAVPYKKSNVEIVGLIGYSFISASVVIINKIILNDIKVYIDSDNNSVYLKQVLFLKDYQFDNYENLKSFFFEKKSVKSMFYEVAESVDFDDDKIKLHEINAKWIDYKGLNKWDDNKQNLLCFPELVGEVFYIKTEYVREYVSDFLPVESLIYLKQVPIIEKGTIEFKKVAICFEVLIDEDYIEKESYLLNYDSENSEKIEKKYNQNKFKYIDHEHNYIKFRDELITYIKSNKIGEKKRKEGGLFNDYFNTLTAKIQQYIDNEVIVPEKLIIDLFLDKYGYCELTHSYETDLFSYKYQFSPPYYTKNYNNKNFKLVLKKSAKFISEGRKEEFYKKEDKVVSLRAFSNYTYFFNSHLRVWHIVITPEENNTLDEFDIIRLMKYFSGSQELSSGASNNEEEFVSFIIGENNHPVQFNDFFENLLDIKLIFKEDAEKNIKKLLKSGIVSIDLDENYYPDISIEKANIVKNELANKFGNLYTKIIKKEGDLGTDDIVVEDIFKALCGITLGIFDFGRMGIEEISDTLSPREKSITQTSFLTINRGVLTSYAIGDNVFNSSYKTLGMNPYLMIPSAVLAHNDYVSRDAETKLNDLWIKCSPESDIDIKMEKLLIERNLIDDLINDDILPNVFQYPTEQELYSYGMKHRGIQDRVDEVRIKLVQLEKIIEQKQTQKNQSNEKAIQLILTFLSLLQIASFCADFSMLDGKLTFALIIGFFNKPIQSLQYWVLGLAIFIFAVILYFVKKNDPIKIKKNNRNG